MLYDRRILERVACSERLFEGFARTPKLGGGVLEQHGIGSGLVGGGARFLETREMLRHECAAHFERGGEREKDRRGFPDAISHGHISAHGWRAVCRARHAIACRGFPYSVERSGLAFPGTVTVI